jgi:hypothetical protein
MTSPQLGSVFESQSSSDFVFDLEGRYVMREKALPRKLGAGAITVCTGSFRGLPRTSEGF